MTITQLLSWSSRISLERYHHRHTMVAFERAISAAGWRYDSSNIDRNKMPFRNYAKRPWAGVCLPCIAEDVAAHGFSWDRRAHQLWGVETCEAHDFQLLTVDAKVAFKIQPHEWVARNRSIAAISCGIDNDDGRAFISRHRKISIGLLHRETPIDSVALNRVVRARARTLIDLPERRTFVGDAERMNAPQRWLSEHFSHRRFARYSAKEIISGRRSATVATDVHALSIATFFDSLEHCVAEIAALPESAEIFGLN